MNKIIIFNKEGQEVDSVAGVLSFTPYLDKVEFESEVEGTGSREGFEGYYVVVDEGLTGDEIDLAAILNFYRPLKADELSQKCLNAITAGFEYEGEHYDYDQIAQNNLSSTMLQLLLNPTLDQVFIKSQPKGERYVTRDEFLAIYNASEEHKADQRSKYATLKENVLNGNFETLEKLKNVTWDYS